MMRLLVALALSMLARPALAEGTTATPRVSLHYGLGFPVGPKVRTNGQAYGNPSSWMPLPAPELAAGFDVLLASHWLFGLEARGFFWTTDVETDLGYDPHGSVDVGVSPAYRVRGVDDARSEAHFALPIGVSFDFPSARAEGPRAEGLESSPGFHVGLVAGYQRRWEDSAWGHVFEAGVIYHRLTQRVTYRDAGDGAADDIVYQPISFFVRAGLVLYFGR